MENDDSELPGEVDGDVPLMPIKPYLIRAWHQWCTDQGLTPHLLVQMAAHVRAPLEYARDGQLVLNVSYEATDHLQMGNDWIEFSARFGGKARDIALPVGQILAIYARENGHGMGFEPPAQIEHDSVTDSAQNKPAQEQSESKPNGPDKGLRRVK